MFFEVPFLINTYPQSVVWPLDTYQSHKCVMKIESIFNIQGGAVTFILHIYKLVHFLP